METIKDLDQHTVCTADPFRGVIERICRSGRERILIYLPVGGEITISGGDFIGAIGSRLCVDKVRLICTREE